MLSPCRIVLMHTSHPGNIGAAARAMKTMGFKELYLVSPKVFPATKAYEMASGALDVLENAKVVANLEDAIHDCSLIVGTSARDRKIPWPKLTPRDFAQRINQETHHKIAILFGCEQSGLTNEALQQCHYHLSIPTASEYSSLNLAAAVQIIVYELCIANLAPITSMSDNVYATYGDVNNFYAHLEAILIKINFLNPKVPRQLMTRLRRLFNRARLDVMEVNILRGILNAIEMKMKP